MVLTDADDAGSRESEKAIAEKRLLFLIAPKGSLLAIAWFNASNRSLIAAPTRGLAAAIALKTAPSRGLKKSQKK